jgi:hypothetical protein
MIIMMPEQKVKGTAKRLRKVLQALGIESRHTECLELAARLCRFNDWRHFLARDVDEPLSLFDEYLTEHDFAARDEFQMGVLAAAGLAQVARELLDRVNPTGSWAKQANEEPVFGAIGGNDQL